ncbi:MAG: hypothetical protein IPK83_14405 [Planctomycetes bacterium]|nr:hypothetical protein [Planctomycetota bacterium]
MTNDLQLSSGYSAVRTNAAILSRNSRGLLELTGDDRAKWLNNLVTNVITTLQPGEGNYAFVVNIKGRVQFDLNMLVRPDRLLLDIDTRWIAAAEKFLNRYIITEKVEIQDVSAGTCRMAVIGPRAHETVAKLGIGNLTPMAWLQNTECRIYGTAGIMFRNDFTGRPGAEFILFGTDRDSAREHIVKAARDCGAIEIDPAVAGILRIESGIPAGVDDIDEEVIPPETGQIERGISYHKGCYLGQEVIERMRSHKILARKLVGVKFEMPGPGSGGESSGDAGSNAAARMVGGPMPRLTKLFINDAEVGRTMSGCVSPGLGGAPLSLAYIKTAHANPGTAVIARNETGEYRGSLIALPIQA